MNDAFDFTSTPELKEIYEQYLLYLAEQIGIIASLSELSVNGDDSADEKLRSIAHSLTGSGETYGFNHISEKARSLETTSADEVVPAASGLIEAIREALLATSSRGSNS